MKLGTHIKLPDGRIGTVVYNSIAGVGIKWGIHNPNPKDFEGSNGGLVGNCQPPEGFDWFPEAMLRNHDVQKYFEIPCVGEDYELLEIKEEKENELGNRKTEGKP